jgi:bis(5'-adenosyl)-triphosphatase
MAEPSANPPILFHQFIVTPQVFYKTTLSFAFTNIKPLLPGHILVSPLRIVSRISQLNPLETTDLFLTVQQVAKMLERVYSASAINVVLQDGVDAGQSVEHVHVHLVPRKLADLDDEGGIDAVYDRLEEEDGDLKLQFRRTRGRGVKVDEEAMESRSEEVMKEEADMLRAEMVKDLAASEKEGGMIR